jgi:hypothetical protein
MPKPIVCDIEDIRDQIGPATLAGYMYTPVDIVLHAVSAGPNGFPIIEFTRFGQPTTPRHTAEWGNPAHMWIACPSTFPADEAFLPATAGDPPLVGAYGRLYLTETVFARNAIPMVLEPKWPPKLATQDPIAHTLDLYPTSLTISGVELRTGELREARIDLLDPMQAAARQTLELDGTRPVRLRLTQASFNQLALPFTPERDDDDGDGDVSLAG